MDFPDHFSGHARLYAEARPVYPATLFAWIAAIAPARDRAWDCGCGNGQAALALAQHFTRVEASDASAAQIALAASHPRVSYRAMPAEASAHGDASFDAVCVAQALHWFDLPRYWAEVRRVLRPSGVFVAWGYDAMHVTAAIDSALDATVLDALAPYWPAQNALLWNGYRGIDFPLATILAPHFEIRLDWSLDQLLAYLASWSATRAALAADPGFLVRARERLLPDWGEAAQPREIRMPLHLRAGRLA